MSQGKLLVNQRIRCLVPKCLVDYLKLDIELLIPEENDQLWSKNFPLKKVPCFINANSRKISEVIAILYYIINLSDNKKIQETLLGGDVLEESQILRWCSLANTDFCGSMANALKPLRGDLPYNKKQVEDGLRSINSIISVYEERLKTHTYLVGERITLADLLTASIFGKCVENLLGSEWRSEHQIIMRWFKTIIDSPIMKSFYVDFKMCEKILTPPQKKQSTKNGEVLMSCSNSEISIDTKKAKHPLELLGKPTMNLDEWKRKYSNEDVRKIALPWFWEHYNQEEYSIWKVNYKYNNELTLTFMSNNLIGGFFNRLSASIKYMFGCLVVYGTNHNNGIIGAILVRGQNYIPAFEVAPDFDSYEYTKLDPTNNGDKEFIANLWTWDTGIIIDGEIKEIVDGKVLK